jgi:hypothetical protein
VCTDPRARKPQVKRAALPSAPAYSLDPEERKQRTKRDIIEGRNKKGEPADKVSSLLVLLIERALVSALLRSADRLVHSSCSLRAEAKDGREGQDGQGQDRGGLPAALQRTRAAFTASLARIRCSFASHLHLSLSLAVQEKHRGESLVAQHAKTAKEQQAAKVLMRTVDRCLLVVSCSCSRLLHIPFRRRLSCACV